MPRTLETTVYKFDELEDSAKEKAREWWRQAETETCDLLDSASDDFETIAKILGIEFKTRAVKLMGGGTRYDPIIYFSGFSSQGDGACFEGSYSYAKGSVAALKKHAPQDTRLHEIAAELFDAQRRAFYRLEARVAHRGHYYHSGCTEIDVCDTVTGYNVDDDKAEPVITALRSFMDWIYRQLESEYEYRLSDENVDESIRANEYEFTEDGHIA